MTSVHETRPRRPSEASRARATPNERHDVGRKKKPKDEEQPDTLGPELSDEDLEWADEEDDTEAEVDEELAVDETVEKSLSDKAVRDRQTQLSDATCSILDLEEKRKELLGKINGRLKKLKKTARRLATEIQTRAERVPKQVEAFPEAVRSRRGAKRPHQDNGAVVSEP
jgi:hypothetical protein